MADDNVSLDEYLNDRKAVVNHDGVVFKGATSARSWNDEKRSARFVMSAQDVDRDGDIIVTAGIDTTEFEKNPIMLINHNANLRGGQWENFAKVGRRMEGDAVFKAAGLNPLVDEAAADVKAGILRGASIGFRPLTIKRREMEDGKPVYGYLIEASKLWECSVVTIPAQALALVKGVDGDRLRLAREFIEKIFDEYVKDPSTGVIVPKAEWEAARKEADGNKTTVTVTEPEPAATTTDRQTLAAKFTRFLDGLFPEGKAAVVEAEQKAITEEQAALPTAEEIAAVKAKAAAVAARL